MLDDFAHPLHVHRLAYGILVLQFSKLYIRLSFGNVLLSCLDKSCPVRVLLWQELLDGFCLRLRLLSAQLV